MSRTRIQTQLFYYVTYTKEKYDTDSAFRVCSLLCIWSLEIPYVEVIREICDSVRVFSVC